VCNVGLGEEGWTYTVKSLKLKSQESGSMEWAGLKIYLMFLWPQAPYSTTSVSDPDPH